MMKSFASALLCLAAGILSGENLIPGDSSFETGHGVWNETVPRISGDASDGRNALRLDGKIAQTTAVFTLKDEKPYVFSVALKSLQKTPANVLLMLYRTNWNGKYITRTVNVTDSWQRYELPVPPQKLGGHNRFWLYVVPKDNACVLMDAPQLEEGEKAAPYASAETISMNCEVECPVLGRVFYPGEPVRASLHFYNAGKENAKFRSFITVRDYTGKTVLDNSREISLEPKDEKTESFLIPCAGLGFYTIHSGIRNSSGILLREQTDSFSIVPKPAAKAEGAGRIFGLCAGPLHYFPSLERIGVRRLPVGCRWAYNESPGQFDEKILGNVEKQIDLIRIHNMEPVVYLRRTARYAAMKQHPHDIFPPEEKFIGDYEDFAYRTAKRFKGKVRCYQMWGGEADLLANTVEGDLGMDKKVFAKRVADLCRAGYNGIKRADPDAIVQTTAVSGVDCTNAAFAFHSLWLPLAKGCYDEIVIHPYSYPWQFDKDKEVQSPEQAGLFRKYDVASKIAGGKPVANGEYGFSIAPQEPLGSKASMKMASYMARSFLISAVNKNVSELMYYCAQGNYDSFSIWAWPNPRPVVPAYAVLSNLLNGASEGELLRYGSLIEGMVFKKGTGSVGTLYIPSDKKVSFLLKENHKIRILDMMGNPVSGEKLTLSDAPLYFTSTLSRKELAEYFLSGIPEIQPFSIGIRAERDDKLVFYLMNQMNKSLSGTLQGKAGTQSFSIPFENFRPGIRETVSLRLDKPFTGTETVAGTLETSFGTNGFQERLELIPCLYMPSITVDGNLEKWKDRPSIDLATTEFLFPPDAASHSLWQNAADLSLKAYVGWNEKYFYFAARVYDDVFVNKNPAESLWAGDCIQMAFDTLNDSFDSGYRHGDCEFGFAYSEKEGKTVWSRTYPSPSGSPSGIKAVVRAGNGKIDYEVAIPFRLLAFLTAADGNVFGFNFTALDSDREKVDYWMGLTYGICGGKNPSLFKKFVLKKALPGEIKK